MGLLVGIDALLRHSWLATQHASLRLLLNYACSLVFLACVLHALSRMLLVWRLVVAAAFVIAPLLIQYTTFSVYAQWVCSADFVALNADPRSMLSAIGAGTAALPLLIRGALLCVACLPLFSRKGAAPPPVTSRLSQIRLTLLAAAATGLALVAANFWYAAPTLQHPLLASASVVFSIAKRALRTTAPQPKPALDYAPVRLGTTPNIILVIGESLCKHRLHLYGYSKPTTPNLDEMVATGELVAMQNSVVLGPTTRVAVPYILTGLEGPDPSGRVYATPTIIEYARARGYDTASVSAQDLRWGELDNFFRQGTRLFRSGLDLDGRVNILKGIDDLTMLDAETLPMLAKLEEPFLLVVHLDGSHMPYSTHSPASIKQFLPETNENDDNAYDNSVLVTDRTLARLARALRTRSADAWMFFTSDHGQALGQGGTFFSRGYQSNIIDNPMLIFPPERQRALLRSRASAQTSSADLAPTIYDLIGVVPTVAVDGQSLVKTDFASVRDRVSSAYSPTLANEPMMMWIDKLGQHRLYDLERGQVTLGNGSVVPRSVAPLPANIEARLHPR
jgi:glucan phosphoethanolaminetransferase (alkaline phosphatase superfamily)